jgi:hypothetical protein
MAFNLGDISPLAGIATGKGMIGKLAGKGGLGLLPKLFANDAQDRRAAEEEAAKLAGEDMRQQSARERTAYQVPKAQMKKGGKVSSASRRADGIAQRGKTRA